jgi:hypothetical protein
VQHIALSFARHVEHYIGLTPPSLVYKVCVGGGGFGPTKNMFVYFLNLAHEYTK